MGNQHINSAEASAADADKLAATLAGATPGPWWVCEYDAGDRNYYDHGGPCPSIQAPDDQDCAIVHWDGFKQRYWSSANGNQRQITANAALIAMAPDLAAEVLRLKAALAERDRVIAELTAANALLVTREAEAENKRVKEWNNRRDAEASRDVARAVYETMRAERDSANAQLAKASAVMTALVDRYDEVVTTPDCSCGQDDHDVMKARAWLAGDDAQ